MAGSNGFSFRSFIPRTAELFRKGPGAYNFSSFLKDCVAGLTVGVVALPLAMAFSIGAGGTPAQGLYTAILAGFSISLLGGSRYQIGGPTGAFVIIIFGIITKYGMSGLTLATLLAGLMLILMGISGLGRLIKFIPYPVTTGFTTGIGLLIFSQQINNFFGLGIDPVVPQFIGQWQQYIGAVGSMQPLTLGVGLGTVLLILLVRKIFPRIPSSVIGVAVATIAVWLLRLPVSTIGSHFGGIPSTLPVPSFTMPSLQLVIDILPSAFTIAMLAGIESLLSAVVADGMTGDRHNANVELVAQGVGNIASGLFGGIPATGAIARTATNIKAGAVSPVAGMIHALVLVLFILFLAPLASSIPLASLSAVLMVVAWDMSDPARFIRLLRKAPRSDAIVLLSTFALTALTDLTFAVEVGIVMAAFLFIRRMAEVSDIRPLVDTQGIVSPQVDASSSAAETLVIPADTELYEISGPFFFGVADILKDTLDRLEKAPKVFVLRMREVPAVDSTGLNALEHFHHSCARRKTVLILSGVQEQPRKALQKDGLYLKIGENNICGSIEQALARAAEITAAV